MILRQLSILPDEQVKALVKKMAPPLVTLLSAEPEMQYVALRNISLIIQKQPSILQNDIKVRESRSCSCCVRDADRFP